MTALEITSESKNISKLEIVWRNPNPVPVNRRCYCLESAGERPLYIQEEFLDDGHFGYWTTISDLEVMKGGRAA
jgi:hypothetical protein